MKSMTEVTRRPVWLGFVFAPLLTPLIFFLICAVYFLATGENHAGSSWITALGFFYLFGVPLGYLAIGLLGWPWIRLLRRWHRLRVGYVCLGAGIIGILAFASFIILIGSQPSERAVLTSGLTLAAGLVAGLLSGLIFCLISGVPFKSKD